MLTYSRNSSHTANFWLCSWSNRLTIQLLRWCWNFKWWREYFVSRILNTSIKFWYKYNDDLVFQENPLVSSIRMPYRGCTPIRSYPWNIQEQSIIANKRDSYLFYKNSSKTWRITRDRRDKGYYSTHMLWFCCVINLGYFCFVRTRDVNREYPLKM